jgi:hypothetical protein
MTAHCFVTATVATALLSVGWAAHLEHVSEAATVTIDWTVEPSEAAGLTSEKLVSFNFDWHPPNEVDVPLSRAPSFVQRGRECTGV